MVTPREVGQRHGLKQGKSARPRHLDSLTVRGAEEQLLESVERWPAIATAVDFNVHSQDPSLLALDQKGVADNGERFEVFCKAALASGASPPSVTCGVNTPYRNCQCRLQ